MATRSGKEDSTLEVEVSGRQVNGGDGIAGGVETDHLVRRLAFCGLPMLGAGQTVTIHWAAEVSGDTVGAVELLTKADGVFKYLYEIGSTMSQYTRVNAYVQVVSGEKKWNTEAFSISFSDLPDADGSAEAPDPTLMDEAIAQLNAAIESVTALEETLEEKDAARGASVTKSGRTTTISISDPSGNTSATVQDAITYTPSVSEAGVISWTNDGGATNPASVDLAAAALQKLLDQMEVAEGESF